MVLYFCHGLYSAYHDVPMGEVQKEGEVRDTFVGLSRESAEIGRRLGVVFPEDPVTYNLKVIDKLDPHSTASMQKDLARAMNRKYKACCSI